ncbi:hypothetical protein [Amycolatopsis sp. NPDC059021]|uniref:hypothetical protein n=1 Tax=Amycolatopsis sp. NPDC059021 TaxID=3346704 RepID=UPI00366A5817
MSSLKGLNDLDPEILDYLENAPLEHLRCRVLGHGWDQLHEGYIVQEDGAHRGCLTQRVQCWRCLSEGLDTFDSNTLERVGTREYSYVDGYLQAGVEVPRQLVRRYLHARTRTRRSASKVRNIATMGRNRTARTRAA